MKFLRSKYFIVIILVILFFSAGAYFQLSKRPWVNIYKSKLNQTIKDQSNNKKTIIYNGKSYNVVQQKKFTMNVYTGMNIRFDYPDNIELKQINSQLISLNDKSDNDQNGILYVYSTSVPENTDNFKIPFTLPGPMKHSSIIKIHGFIANQETYSDEKNEVDLLVLRKGDQTIVLRTPQNSKPLEDTITQVVNSIQTLQ